MTQAMHSIEAIFFFALQGPIQDINLAEIMAPTVSIWFGGSYLVINSDSAYFVGGWQRGPAWCTKPNRIFADIWRLFWQAATDFGTNNIEVRKVKGHATLADVAEGRSTVFERWGNIQADKAAKRGARLHRVSTQDRTRLLRATALSTMVSKYVARTLALVSLDPNHSWIVSGRSCGQAVASGVDSASHCNLVLPLSVGNLSLNDSTMQQVPSGTHSLAIDTSNVSIIDQQLVQHHMRIQQQQQIRQ